MAVIDAEQVIVAVNPTALEVLGVEEDLVLGAPAAGLAVGGEMVPSLESLAELGREGAVASVPRPDGSVRSISWHGSMVEWHGGQAILVCGQDVTANEQLRRLGRLAQQRTQAVMELERVSWSEEKQLLERALSLGIEVAESTVAVYARLNVETSVLEPVAQYVAGTGMTSLRGVAASSLPVHDAWQACRSSERSISGRSAWSVDGGSDPAEGTGSLQHLSVPILAGGRISGVLSVGRPEPAYDPIEAEHVAAYAMAAAEIVQRWIVEAAARRADRLRAAAFDSMAEGVAIYGADGRIHYANAAAQRITRSEALELADRVSGDDRWELSHPDGRRLEPGEAPSEVTLRTGDRVKRMPLGITRADGTRGSIEVSSTAIELPDGERGALLTVTDLTGLAESEARAAEAQHELEASEHRWRTLAALTREAIIVSEDGQILDVNPAFERLLGYAASEAIGQDLADLLAPERLVTVHRERVARGEVGEWRTMVRAETGEEIPVHSEARLVEVQGRTVRVSLLRDLRDEQTAQRRLELFGVALEQAGESVVITNADSVIEYVNPAFERVTGYSSDEVIGRRPSVLKSGKHPAEYYQEMWSTLTAGEVWLGRLYNRRKDGELFQEEATITPIVDESGQITHFLGLKRDITRELELESQLLQSQKLESLGQLAGGVAHDFNNLLSIMMGNAELLMLDLEAGTEGTEELEEIIEAGSRAAAITRQLLLFSRSQPDSEPVHLDVNQVLMDSSKLYRRLLDERVELVHELHPDLPRVSVDPTNFAQVVMNMTVNARDAMPDGGHLTYRTRIAMAQEAEHPDLAAGAYVMLEVSDTGIGMDAGTAAKVFEPFFTTKREGKGTGLGLATCYGIVRQAGGTITVQSTPGRGTTFRVWLPEAVGPERVATSGRQHRALQRGVGHVLVVEDSGALRNVTAMGLRKAGYQVTTCVDGQDAVDLLDGGLVVDAVISDLIMPRKGGLELARYVRATFGAELPVLLMSGYAETVTAADIRAVEAEFMTKPFTIQQLTERLGELLPAA